MTLPETYSDHVRETHEREKAKHGPALPASNADKVRLFHKVAGVPFPTLPTIIKYDEFDLAKNLIEEELQEWEDAYRAGDIVEVADAIADLLYVAYRAGLAFGLPVDEVFAEVHRSNMTKFPDGKVLRRWDGKIMKPESWEPPKIKEILENAGYGATSDRPQTPLSD